MNALISKTELTMTSREIAEVTGKRHPDVKRDVENMMEQLKEDVSKFAHIYLDSMNRKQAEYRLDRRHVDCLLTGYSAQLRMKVIDRWRELESAAQPKQQFAIPQTYAEALRLAAEQAEQLAIAAPKASVYDRIVDRGVLMTATQVGQKLSLSAIKLNRILTDLDVYHCGVKRARVFRQWFIDGGYGEMKQTEEGYSQPLFTNAGEMWIVSKLTGEGII